ncbi:4a-hydroxytetrahydrobiopterin dehydratase [Candidatus Woesearchaeota archaeon]|nr:4a-hydroxytetrahydrobiopterin dehydratase [Candidatus Woesearchaeota archaeon]
MKDLATKKCVPCEGGIPPLKGKKLQEYLSQVSKWNVVEEHHLTKKFKFKDFKTALKFVNKVGELAEQEGHHPNISFTWGKVEITLFTHAINGLSENDFILARKIDLLS